MSADLPAPLHDLLASLPGSASVAKRELRAARDALLADISIRWPAPGHASRRLTAFFDAVVRAVFAQACAGAGGLSLLAVGGFGRGELAPGSDLDLVLLHRASADPGSVATCGRTFFQGLWDLGLQVGHAVRPVEDLDRVLREDLPSATALLSSRRLAGDPGLAKEAVAAGAAFLQAEGLRFLHEKLEELGRLHVRYGRSPSATHPHLKAGAGGLRDLELLALAARVGPEQLPAPRLPLGLAATVAQDRGRLLDLRFALHLVEGHKQDVLGVERLSDVTCALALGRTGAPPRPGEIERAMRWHVQAAREATRALGLVGESVRRARRRGEETGRFHARRPLAPGLVRVGARIETDRPRAEWEPPDGAAAVRLVLLAQREKLDLGADVLEALRRARERLPGGALAGPEVSAALWELLSGDTQVAQALEDLHRTGLLAAIVCELDGVAALYLRDPFHTLTVDAHLLRAVRELERFSASTLRADRQRAELFARTPHRAVLRLGTLLHDMGKGRGGGHVKIGTDMVADLGLRLRLPLEETRLLRFLVAEHQLLPDAADRYRGQDAAAAERLASRIKTEERLDLLYLLSVADARAAGPHGLPRWRDALLCDLVEEIRGALRGVAAPVWDDAAHRRETLAGCRPPVAPERYDHHLARCPRRYRLEVEPWEAAVHLSLVARLEAGEDPAFVHGVDGPFGTLWVAARDRTGLFADLTGAIAAARRSIVDATLYTRTDGVALDRLRVAVDPSSPIDEETWQRLEARLRRVLAGERSVPAMLEAAARGCAAAPPGAQVPVEVRASARASDRYTVLDVTAPDRLGLLYALCRRLAELGIDIHGAKVATRGPRALDVFHVTRDGKKIEDERALRELCAALSETASAR